MSSASGSEGETAGEFTEVVIVRHGETSWNASRIIQWLYNAHNYIHPHNNANVLLFDHSCLLTSIEFNNVCFHYIVCGEASRITSIASSHGGLFILNLIVMPEFKTVITFEILHQGHLDAELNEIGRQQAVAVAHRLSKEVKPAAIYSSDLKRAAETAQTIARICNLPNVVFDPALRERHIGDLQGMKLQDAATEKPDAYKAFMSHKRNQQIPGGGESLDQLSERCVSYLYNIVEKHKGERVIVVSHGGTIRELYRHASPMKPLHGKIHNTSVSVILVSGTTGRCIVKTVGDISHLQETGVLENAFGGDKTSA
ncbi:hypothetical protein ACP70R_014901 [Stipagrostis hirtigluma subsp. patula]